MPASRVQIESRSDGVPFAISVDKKCVLWLDTDVSQDGPILGLIVHMIRGLSREQLNAMVSLAVHCEARPETKAY